MWFLWQNPQIRHMKNSLRHFAVLVSLVPGAALLAAPDGEFDASAGGQVGPGAPIATNNNVMTSGDRLLAEAVSRLERRRSVTASLRHQVFLDGAPLYGVGTYCQLGGSEELHVRMELRFAGQEARLLQVSNSRFLWLDCVLPTGRTVSRIDLRQLRSDPVLTATAVAEIGPGEASWLPAHAGSAACCGGLPHLLAALGENFTFLPPQAMRLVSSPDASTTGLPLFAAVGHWRAEKLAELMASPKSKAGAPTAVDLQLPTNRMPQEVLLLVDQNQLFPYRIEYRPMETSHRSGPNGAPAPYQLSARPLVVLEFFNVAFDAEVEAGQFDYAPPDADWVDHTAALIDQRRRERQATIATRANAGRNLPPSR